MSARTGVEGIPSIAETIEVARCIAMAEFTGTQLHFSQISTEQSVALIKQAKTNGLNITADVSVNHLFLSEIDVSEFDTNCLLQPPLRSLRDQKALLLGLQDGTLDAVCSGHCPLDVNSKHVPFSEALPGISNIEAFLPLTYRLVVQGQLTASNWIKLIASNPAKIIQRPLGNLSVGSQADVIVFNPKAEFTVKKDELLSNGKNTPYHNWHLQGKAESL